MSLLPNSYQLKDIAVRTAKTAFAAFVAAFVVPTSHLFDLASWKAAALVALTAAGTAVHNYVLAVLRNKKDAVPTQPVLTAEEAETHIASNPFPPAPSIVGVDPNHVPSVDAVNASLPTEGSEPSVQLLADAPAPVRPSVTDSVSAADAAAFDNEHH